MQDSHISETSSNFLQLWPTSLFFHHSLEYFSFWNLFTFGFTFIITIPVYSFYKKVKNYNQQLPAVYFLISKPASWNPTTSNVFRCVFLSSLHSYFLRPCVQGTHRQKQASLSQSTCSLRYLVEYLHIILNKYFLVEWMNRNVSTHAPWCLSTNTQQPEVEMQWQLRQRNEIGEQ